MLQFIIQKAQAFSSLTTSAFINQLNIELSRIHRVKSFFFGIIKNKDSEIRMNFCEI